MARPTSDRLSQVYALLWLIFLIAPLLSIWLAPAPQSLPLQILATLATLVFGAFYSVFVLRSFVAEHDTTPFITLLLQLVVLLALITCAVPVLGGYVLGFTPYLFALLVYSRPVREALAWFAAITVPSLAVYFITQINPWGLGGPTLAIVFILAGRVQVHMSERIATEHEKLALSRERELIARDIHDILGHSLTVLSLKTQVAREYLRTDPERATAELDAIAQLTTQALGQVRSTAYQLGTLDLESQVAAATVSLNDAGITVHRAGDWCEFTPAQRAFAAWVVREAVTNVLRHSGARNCWLDFRDATVTVRDDGRGMGESPKGFGLNGLHSRALEAGYDLSITSNGRGTTVTARLGRGND